MEAKEKAIQLVKDYHNIVLDVMPIEYRATRLGANRTIKISAKQCALIAVEEILGVLFQHHEIDYWQQVKQEIEKL